MKPDSQSKPSPCHIITRPDVLLFVVQVMLIFLVVFISIINLSIGCENPNFWTVILTSCLGYIMPNPKMNVKNGNIVIENKSDKKIKYKREKTNDITPV